MSGNSLCAGGRCRPALASRSFGWCERGGSAAKSPVGTGVTVGGERAVHAVILDVFGTGLLSQKNKPPDRMADRGFLCNVAVGDPVCRGACSVSDAGVAKPIPIKGVTDRFDRAATRLHARSAERYGSYGGIDHGVSPEQ